MPTIKEQLAKLHEEERAIQARIQALYDESLRAPADEKACPDWMAEMLGSAGAHADTMKYPIEVAGITYTEREPVEYNRREVGKFVAVRPCAEEYGNKTFLGIYLGQVATSPGCFYNKETGILEIGLWMHNPAIWVPDLKRIIFGMGSWWGMLNSPADLKQISDADIQNVWYVKALNDLTSESKA